MSFMLRKETEDVYGLYALEQHNNVAKAQLDFIFSKKITWSKSRRNFVMMLQGLMMV